MQEAKDQSAELAVQLEMTKVEMMGDTFHSRGNSLFGEVSAPPSSMHVHVYMYASIGPSLIPRLLGTKTSLISDRDWGGGGGGDSP